jgi:hypothetical protein
VISEPKATSAPSNDSIKMSIIDQRRAVTPDGSKVYVANRGTARYSPDRVDALVWAFSELLVEPMKGEGIFELYRRDAESAEQRDKPQPTRTTWAIGSMESQAEQKKSR